MAKRKRDYKKEYRDYHSKPKQKKRRAQRNASRRKLAKQGKVRPGDKKDVHHKDGNPANQSADNLSVTTRKYNRGHGRRKKAELDTRLDLVYRSYCFLQATTKNGRYRYIKPA